MKSEVNDGSFVHLEAGRLGDPVFDQETQSLTFTGKGAVYVAEMLSEARAERTRRVLVAQYVAAYNRHATAGLTDREIFDLLDAFAITLLNSSAAR